MKTTRLITIGISMIFVLAACQAQPPVATPEPGLVETQVASTVAAQAAKMTAEYEQLLAQATPTPPPTHTPEPSPTATATVEASPTPSPTSAVAFRDDFEGALAEGWTWIRENKQLWDLSANSGYLRITLNPGNCGGVPRNIPLQPLPQDNYEISTFLEFTPIKNFQLAGLIVYQDDGNLLKLGRAFCNVQQTCVGNGIYFDNLVSGALIDGNYATSTDNPSKIYLRLQRTDNLFTGFFSEDGQNWIKIGQHTNNLQPVGVGLFAGQSCQGSVPADFDYFEIIQLP
jgi:beta-xylosidase